MLADALDAAAAAVAGRGFATPAGVPVVIRSPGS